MISLRIWLFSLLLALPFYTYSLNARSSNPQEDVFEEVKEDIEKRQNFDDIASLSSVYQSISEYLESLTNDPSALATADTNSILSVYLSLASEIDFLATATGAGITAIPTTSGGLVEETGTPGQVITDGTRTGTVGVDGTTRFCSASSYLCPASVDYGCCKSGYRCGLTACTPTGAIATSSEDAPTCSFGSYACASSVGGGCCPTGYECGLTACTPTGSNIIISTTQSKTIISFEPTETKGDPTETSSTPTNTNAGNTSGGKKGMSGGTIGGIVGGVVGGIALIAGGLVWFCLSKRKGKQTAMAPAPIGGHPQGPTEGYTGGPIPPQPQMSHYNSPTSPPPQGFPPQQPGGYYQPYAQQQYPGQQGPPTQGGYPQYGQNVSELGGVVMPHGQKAVDQPPQNISEAPNNTMQQPPQGGPKASTGPVYELS